MDKENNHKIPSLYEAVTNDIRIQVQPFYLKGESNPESQHYIWAYKVQIFNESNKVAQLINRHWEITNQIGKCHVVDGTGVVGKQPVLNPGDMFEYTSAAPLDTPSGFMKGHYEMIISGDILSEIEIPPFPLDIPNPEIVKH